MTPEELKELVKRSIPEEIAKDICSVQPMDGNTFVELYKALEGKAIVFHCHDEAKKDI